MTLSPVFLSTNGVSVYYTIILFPNIWNHVEISKEKWEEEKKRRNNGGCPPQRNGTWVSHDKHWALGYEYNKHCPSIARRKLKRIKYKMTDNQPTNEVLQSRKNFRSKISWRLSRNPFQFFPWPPLLPNDNILIISPGNKNEAWKLYRNRNQRLPLK